MESDERFDVDALIDDIRVSEEKHLLEEKEAADYDDKVMGVIAIISGRLINDHGYHYLKVVEDYSETTDVSSMWLSIGIEQKAKALLEQGKPIDAACWFEVARIRGLVEELAVEAVSSELMPYYVTEEKVRAEFERRITFDKLLTDREKQLFLALSAEFIAGDAFDPEDEDMQAELFVRDVERENIARISAATREWVSEVIDKITALDRYKQHDNFPEIRKRIEVFVNRHIMFIGKGVNPETIYRLEARDVWDDVQISEDVLQDVMSEIEPLVGEIYRSQEK